MSASLAAQQLLEIVEKKAEEDPTQKLGTFYREDQSVLINALAGFSRIHRGFRALVDMVGYYISNDKTLKYVKMKI